MSTILPQKPQLYNLSGIPASGKTTEAKRWVEKDPDNRVRVSYDDLRLAMFGADHQFNWPDENRMKKAARNFARKSLQTGKSVVVDNLNLTSRVRQAWETLGKEMGAEVVEKEIDTPVATCVSRDAGREGKARVGRAFIERTALIHGFIDWDDEEIYYKSTSGKDFVICDVDGTLADCSHRLPYIYPAQHPAIGRAHVLQPRGEKAPEKDWKAFFAECQNDTPILPILHLMQILAKSYYVIVVSGRPFDLCGIHTEDWLMKYGLTPLHLFMRNQHDKRKDTEVKQEILDLLPKKRIAYVVEDRPSVIRMWNANGLTTLAVGNLKEF